MFVVNGFKFIITIVFCFQVKVVQMDSVMTSELMNVT